MTHAEIAVLAARHKYGDLWPMGIVWVATELGASVWSTTKHSRMPEVDLFAKAPEGHGCHCAISFDDNSELFLLTDGSAVEWQPAGDLVRHPETEPPAAEPNTDDIKIDDDVEDVWRHGRRDDDAS